MLKKIMAICFVILLLLFIGGCESAEKIESEEEAQEAVVDVSEDISEISDTLESIDEDLGWQQYKYEKNNFILK